MTILKQQTDHIAMPTKAVIFDMDGLLLDTEKVCLEGYLYARRHFSLPENRETFFKCVGRRADASNQIIRDSLDHSIEFNAFNTVWRNQIAELLADEVPLKGGALRLVEILATKNIPMGVATSTQTQQARGHLERVGLLRHLICVVGGDLVEKPKPNPEVYLKVAQQLGVAADNCVAFEDSETGTRAAIASGAQTVQIPDLVQPSESFAKHGQIIATTLLEGAIAIGLISRTDVKETV